MASNSKRSPRLLVLSPVAITVLVLAGTATFGLASSIGKTRTTTGIAASADGLIAKQIADRSKPIADRGRALARLSRQPITRQLLESATETDRATADLRWLLRRDIRELNVLKEELTTVRAGAALLSSNQPTPVDSPILANPLPDSDGSEPLASDFGTRTHNRLKLTSRGIDLATKPGAAVVSPISGTVVYVGKLGQSSGLILESTGFWIVVGGLELDSRHQQRLAVGKTIEQGAAIGMAATTALHLEVRVVSEMGGNPVLPAFETR